MHAHRGRLVGALSAALLVALGLPRFVTPASAAVTVSTEAQLRTAFADGTETSITVANDIDLSDCTASGGDLDRNSGVAVTILGAGFTIRQTCPGERLMEQTGTGAITLDSVTLMGGTPTGTGGAITSTGPVDVTNSTLSNNTAGDQGGAVFSSQAVSVTGSRITRNHSGLISSTGYGGGISAGRAVTVVDSLISHNLSDGGGGINGQTAQANITVRGSTIADNVGPAGAGGIGSFGNVTVTDSTINGNSTPDSGGGGIGAIGTISVTNSTITDNLAGPIGGGGVFSDSGVTLVYATVVHNQVTGGVANVTGPSVNSFGSVVALGVNGGDCAAPGTSSGFNFADDTSCGFTGTSDHQGPGDLLLGSLQDNGGPTQTRAPAADSPLADAIPVAQCHDDGAAGISTDQRGVTRPQGSGCDIGAVDIAGAIRAVPAFTG